MNAYQTTGWKQKLVFVVATLSIGMGTLELVAGAMKFPGAESMAVREQVLAAQSERAQEIRALQRGEVKVAAIDRVAEI